MNRVTPALDAALRQLEGAAGEDDEWYPSNPGLPLEYLPSHDTCRRILYLTKGAWFYDRFADQIPDDVGIIQRGTLVPPGHARAVSALGASLNAKLLFVGDLDPYDLTTYISLVSGGWPNGAEVDTAGTEYFGVDDRWLALCEGALAGRNMSSVCIRMSAFECAHLSALEASGIDIGAMVGRRSIALLKSSYKLELEGASNPAFYKADFLARLSEHLWRG